MTKPLKTINFGGEDTYHLAPDFKNIENAPFGEETTYGDTLTWDGNTEGLAGVDFEGGGTYTHYCISSTVPSGADVVNGATITMIDGASRPATFTDTGVGLIAENYYEVMIVDENAVGVDIDGLLFDKAGIYVKEGISSLTINGYNGFPTTTVKQLDNKYLEPFETVGGDTLTWDGNTEGLETVSLADGETVLYLISEKEISEEDLTGGTTLVFYVDGDKNEIVSTYEQMVADGAIMPDGSLMIGLLTYIPTDNFTSEVLGATFPKKGFYCIAGPTDLAFTINGYTGFTTTKLKEEYLPDGGLLIDLSQGTITEVDGVFEVSGIPYTPILEQVKKGGSVVLLDEGIMYLFPLGIMDMEGQGCVVSVNLGGEMAAYAFTTA